jgi:ribosome-binding protein aMBF1 (putative translation factor)
MRFMFFDLSYFGIIASRPYYASATLALVEKTIYSEAYAAFCRILRETRERKGITQTALARSVGRPQSFIAKVESGQRRVDVVEFLALAEGLKIHPLKLLALLLQQVDQTKRIRGNPAAGKPK